ncbi:repressor LexA, partial [Candidatus Saccharibacteria bacterium 32-49-10]
MMNPTKKQKLMLDFIDGFVKGRGYSPTLREIMQALGYKSVSTVAKHVDNLV